MKALYTIKTSKGKYPKGVYSVDSPQGIPKLLLEEAERGAKTVEILEYEPEATKTVQTNSEGPEGDSFTTQDTGEGTVNTSDDEEEEKTEEKPKPKKTRKKRTPKKKTESKTDKE
ncbi:MAG: hypothetical protein ACLFPH_07160 [Bacteroidales bacterium]